jgi:adenosylcobinamide-phosphate guanylyltransferase
MIAVVMCGGRGTRMGGNVEKPLLKVGGIAAVQRVISALQACHDFERLIAAVSPLTPATKEFLKARKVEILETAGGGYSQDLSVILKELRPARVLVTPADLPLLSSEVVSEISAVIQKAPVISMVLEKEFVERAGLKPSVVFRSGGSEYCHSGISIFDTLVMGKGISKEEYFLLNRMEIAVNVNRKQDLLLAEKLLIQRA